MTLDDFKNRDWDTLTEQKQDRAVLLICGYGYDSTPDASGEYGDMALITRPDGEPYRSILMEYEFFDCLPNPRTDPGAAMELFDKFSDEYGLVLYSWHEKYHCGFSMTRTPEGWQMPPAPIGWQIATATTSRLAIMEAVFRAWQARQGCGEG